MVMNIIIRMKEKGFSFELKEQNVVNMMCEIESAWCNTWIGTRFNSRHRKGDKLQLLV